MSAALKSRLKSGASVAVCNTDFPTPHLIEFVAGVGFDAVFIDCEHSCTDFALVDELARAARGAGIGSIVRPWSNEPGLINRYLSCGASGMQLPHVHDVAAAQSIIDGISAWDGDVESKVIVAMIESAEALHNLPALLRLPQIDVFYIGAVDLAQSMGHRGGRKHPAVQAAVEDAISRIADAGKAAGMNVQDDLEATQRYRQLGLRWVNVHLKVFLERSMTAFVQGVRAA